MVHICFMCEINKYPIEKILDDDFYKERLNEFYPEEEWGGRAQFCDDCYLDFQCAKIELEKSNNSEAS